MTELENTLFVEADNIKYLREYLRKAGTLDIKHSNIDGYNSKVSYFLRDKSRVELDLNTPGTKPVIFRYNGTAQSIIKEIKRIIE